MPMQLTCNTTLIRAKRQMQLICNTTHSITQLPDAKSQQSKTKLQQKVARGNLEKKGRTEVYSS